MFRGDGDGGFVVMGRGDGGFVVMVMVVSW